MNSKTQSFELWLYTVLKIILNNRHVNGILRCFPLLKELYELPGFGKLLILPGCSFICLLLYTQSEYLLWSWFSTAMLLKQSMWKLVGHDTIHGVKKWPESWINLFHYLQVMVSLETVACSAYNQKNLPKIAGDGLTAP